MFILITSVGVATVWWTFIHDLYLNVACEFFVVEVFVNSILIVLNHISHYWCIPDVIRFATRMPFTACTN